MRGGRGLLILLAIGVLPLAGCDDSERQRSERPPSPADVVPRDTSVYGEATVLLKGKDGRAARRFASAISGQDVPEDALLNLVSDAADADIDFDLLKPWLGTRAAFFMVDRGGDPAATGVVLESNDVRAATRFVRDNLGRGARSRRYRGVQFWRGTDGRAAGLVDGYVVLATSVATMRAAIEARNSPLASTKQYRRARGEDTPFAFILAGNRALREGMGGFIPWTRSERRDVRRLLQPNGDVVIRALVTERQLIVRIEGLRRYGKRPDPIASFPGDAWFAGSSGDLSTVLMNPLGRELGSSASVGRALQGLIGVRVPDDLFRGLRRGTIYFQGGPVEPSGQILAEVASRRATNRAILRFGRAVGRGRTHRVEWISTDRGNPEFDAFPRGGSTGSGFRIELIDRDLVFEFGAVGGGDELADTPAYRQAKRALGEPPTMLVDFQGLLELGDPTGTRDAGPIGRLAFAAAAESNRKAGLSYSFAVGLAPRKPAKQPPDDGSDEES